MEDVKNSASTTTAASARKKTSTSASDTSVLYATVKCLSDIKWPNGLLNGNRREQLNIVVISGHNDNVHIFPNKY